MSESNSHSAHLVFLDSGVVLTKQSYSDWREIQGDFDDYKASLGPWTAAELADYFANDYTKDDAKWPFTRDQMESFFDSDAEVMRAG
jgi:hypothetical protein